MGGWGVPIIQDSAIQLYIFNNILLELNVRCIFHCQLFGRKNIMRYDIHKMKKPKKKLFMLKVKRWISFFPRVDEFFFLVGKRDCNLLLKGLERNLTKSLVELIHNHLVSGVDLLSYSLLWYIDANISTIFLLACT